MSNYKERQVNALKIFKNERYRSKYFQQEDSFNLDLKI